MKSETQLHENTLQQQIKSLKSNIIELEKCNIELATKATFTENDRTLDRLGSMPDLNTSLNNTGRNIHNPEILLLEDGKIKTLNNKILDKTFAGTQVIVNVIQKDREEEVERPQSPNIISPIIHRTSPTNQRSYGIIPLALNQ